MPLYSTDTSSKVIKDKVQNEPQNPGPKEKICPQDSPTNSWCYLFVHHAKVETINEKLILKFKTFIHKSIAYKRGKSHVRKTERPTISGLLNSSYKCNGIHINNLFKFFVWCEVSKSFTRSII